VLKTRHIAKPQNVSRKASIFINLSVAPFYVMPPDKAAAIKMLLYLLTAGWCKVGYSTPMKVNISKPPPFTNPPNVSRKASIFINLSVAPFYVMPPDKAAAIKMLLYLLTAGWCKVGYSTPMNVNLSKTPPFTNPPNVTRKRPWESPEIIRFGLVGLFHRPASTEKLNRIEIIHVFQRPDHQIA
jgi:hypothetical protein